MPPHKRKGLSAMITGLAVSSVLTASMAVIMNISGIPLTTILPTSAPIWMGFATMLFMLLNK